ncbi:MAG TPA: hypothetical protein VE291_13495 [Terracidiphilus sp.]|nr:hypothetical protein [Terracidiphilus sp.]
MTESAAKRNLDACETWAGRLACPVCFRELRFAAERAVCAGCGRAYPVVDGIPVLIPERAVTMSNGATPK